MTETHKQAILIEAGDRNTVESFLNDLRKRADKGKVEFGVDIEIKRIDLEKVDVEGFDD